MNREQNKYKNKISGEVLNATEMLNYVKEEAKRQFEELNGQPFSNMTVDEQYECVLQQFDHQVNGDWKLVQ